MSFQRHSLWERPSKNRFVWRSPGGSLEVQPGPGLYARGKAIADSPVDSQK